MVTRVTRKLATKAAVLKFNPEWFSDPPPPFFKNLNKAQLKELQAAKKQFQAQVKDILARGQR
jgi:hypothetical protein